MPVIRFPSLLGDCAEAHLVVARLPSEMVGDEFQPSNTRATQMMLTRLFKTLPLQGRFAVSVARSRGRPEVMCAFERAADAEQAARVVGASDVAPYEGWASQHAVDLDGETESRLAATAGAQRPSRGSRS